MTEKSSEQFVISFDENGEMQRTPESPQPEQELNSHVNKPELPRENNVDPVDSHDEQESVDTKKPHRGLFRRRSLGRVAAQEDIESPVDEPVDNSSDSSNVLANYLSGKSARSEDLHVVTAHHELGMKEKVFMKVGRATLWTVGAAVLLGGGVYASTSVHLERAPGPIEFTGGVIDNLDNIFNDDVKYKVGESNE